MNKVQLADAIANQHGITKAEAMGILTTALTTIRDTVAAGEDVALHGFGTFKKVHKPERSAVNPATREPIVVAAKDVPRFSPASAFEAAVADGGRVTVAA